MLALVIALQIAAQPLPAAAGSAPVASSPAPVSTQAASPAAVPAKGDLAPKPVTDDPPPKTLEERLADLHVLWTQTCGNRAYGAYDDLCQNLGDEIHRAEREARKARLKQKPGPAPTLQPAAGPVPSVPPAVTAKASTPPAH